MANVPGAFLTNSDEKSTLEKEMASMTQDDGASGLQAVLLQALRSDTVNGQLLGALLVALNAVREVTPFASSARTATASSDPLTNTEARGVILTLDVTAITDTPSIELSVEYKDPASSNYETLFSAAAAVTATGTHTYVLYPGDIVAADDVVEVGKLPLPRTWRVVITHDDSDSITYSCSGSYLL